MKTKKLALAGMYVAVGVVCSPFYIPLGITKFFPIQHMINVLCAVTLGPLYGVMCAFAISLIRNLLGTGTPLAFFGSMIGALLAGIIYNKTKKIHFAVLGEIFGTGIIGALLSYPVARLLLGNSTAAWYGFVIPFSVSTIIGSLTGYLLLIAVNKATKGSLLTNHNL
ncbi:energy coupling factor transporter S component ThiW [Acetobacterium sp.]|uniref:energy coupling factor transporter S component ThiW n=1 Tax=Acetobacterium sp. TaxID=1872094 RepID=UPI002F412E79